MRSQSAASMIM